MLKTQPSAFPNRQLVSALRGSKACAVPLATLVAVRPQAYLMPAAIAAGAVWAGLAERPGLPASHSYGGPVGVRRAGS